MSYGLHHLLNAVTESDGFPSAVLIRAIEPLEGVAVMRARRAAASGLPPPVRDADLGRGPGNLTVAMGISTPVHNTRMLTRGVLTVHDDGTPGERRGVDAAHRRHAGRRSPLALRHAGEPRRVGRSRVAHARARHGRRRCRRPALSGEVWPAPTGPVRHEPMVTTTLPRARPVSR